MVYWAYPICLIRPKLHTNFFENSCMLKGAIRALYVGFLIKKNFYLRVSLNGHSSKTGPPPQAPFSMRGFSIYWCGALVWWDKWDRLHKSWKFTLCSQEGIPERIFECSVCGNNWRYNNLNSCRICHKYLLHKVQQCTFTFPEYTQRLMFFKSSLCREIETRALFWSVCCKFRSSVEKRYSKRRVVLLSTYY